MNFYVGGWNNSADSGTAKMTIAENGAVGIGKINPGHLLDVNGVINAVTDVRAPIFYDSNNTAYYLNPEGTSALQSATLSTLTATTSLTAPIFYDSADSSYYADPAGTSRLSIIHTGNGSATAPAHSFVNDTNTGMYNAGADLLGFTTAGTLRLQITSGGAMGLGITPTNTSGRF